jgi:D-sedoheptulose 7-phosphate isomerase
MPSLTVDSYITQVHAAMAGIDESVAAILGAMQRARSKGKRIWVLGNGGSLAIAQHFAQDLVKLCKVRAQALNCPSMITAYTNDDRFEYSYFNPLQILMDPSDMIIIFSCSGTSRNYIEFVSGFVERNNPIAAIVGTNGGFLKEKADVCAHVTSDDYQVCETAFCVIADILVKSMMGE